MNEDLQLLLLTHKGNEPAARKLWARFAPRLLAYAHSISGSGGDDIVQTVFVSILSQPRAVIRAIEDPAGWLLTLTRRTALNYLRSVRRERTRRRERAAQAEQDARRALPVFVDQETLNAAVSSLPRRLREVIVLRHIAGLTFEQAAAAIGANRNTTASRYRDAIDREVLMNMANSDKWVDRLTPSERRAPEPPAAFLAAVRQRRTRRRMGQAASVAGALLAAALIVSLLPRHAAAPVQPIASDDSVPRISPPIPRPDPVRTAFADAPVISLAAYYTEGRPLDPDHLPTAEASNSRPEREIRGGDRWDLEKVESWLQN